MDIERAVKVFKLNNQEIISNIVGRAKLFDQLLNEASYFIEKILKENRIAIAQLCGRVKDVESICRKQIRKKYENPLVEIEDFVGIRVVCLFVSQMNEIDLVINKYFDVISVSKKHEEKRIDQFGYLASHYIVKLPQEFSGPRYDEIKEQCFEIQVKTLLQDSWATINHKLTYKNENIVPEPIQRAFSAIAGTLELLDHQFDDLRNKVEAHFQAINSARKIPESLLRERTNDESLKKFLTIKYPEWDINMLCSYDAQELIEYKYRTIADVNSLIDRTQEAVNSYMRKYGGGVDVAAPHFSLAMAFDKMKYRFYEYIGADVNAKFSEFDHLVDNDK